MTPEPDFEIGASRLREWVDEGRTVHFLDIREAFEVGAGVVAGARWIPMNSVPDRLDEIPRDGTLIVYCAAGARSFGVTHWLRDRGFDDAWSLVGGLGAWFAEGGERGPEGGP